MKLILYFFLLISFIGYTQQKNPFIIKPNIGASYQSSDINDKTGTAIGLGLSKQLNSQKHWISTSLRLNYIYSRNTGQDYTSSPLTPTNIYLYKNYLSKSHFSSLSLEIGIQKLKELTNVNVYGFGGIGFLDFQSKTNQKDADDVTYDYSTVGTGFFDAKTDLNLLLDKTHETSVSKGNSVTPHFGFGIGYQLTSQIAVNFEQNFILPDTDLLDGNKNSTNNDKLSTSTLTFSIGLGKSIAPPSKQPEVFVPKEQRPFIDMKQPSYKLTTTSNPNYTIKATLKNITNIIQVTVEQNNKVIIPKNLEFNQYSGQISFETQLSLKEEHFKIYVNNSAGHHSRIFTIQFTDGKGGDSTKTIEPIIENVIPPTSMSTSITILTPSKDYIESCNAFISFKLTPELDKNQLITLSNNQPVEFTQVGDKYTIQKQIAGTETFRIITNSGGRQEKQITYRCRPENEFTSTPLITLREPLQDTIKTNANSLYILANFKSRADKVTVSINNQIALTHTYTSGLATNLKLPLGDLIITIETENKAGKDKKTFFVKRP